MRSYSRRKFLGAVLVLASLRMTQADISKGKTYKTGYSSVMKLGRDIHAALPPENRTKIASQPISIETDHRPFARLLFLEDGGKVVRGVWISAGFIDLVNRVAHAKAIDTREKNYLKRYVEKLERETGKGVLRLPDIAEERYWTEGVLNEQQSNFNSIVGMVVGMKLANHYLGHYDKYRDKLDDESLPAINNLLTREEWRETFRHGVRNAVRAGCMTEGAAPFFAALDTMKERSEWAAHFLPEDAQFAAMRPEMARIQEAFLEGGE